MKAGKYTIKELFLNNNIEQIIIPEIQRDYVWEKEQILSLLESIYHDYSDFKKSSPTIASDDQTINDMFKQFYRKQKYSSNIGFIYAYNDAEYKDKYFLIDGQQRLTTMYLLIFALYNVLDKDKFNKYYFNNKILKLDYKVRESAHEFLFNFISNIQSDAEQKEIKNQYWYLSLYDSDITIQSILENYFIIKNFLNDKNLNNEFLDYIENYTEFWFFDTSISKQGEELYLSMNSRGEAIQTNENIKALLLKELGEKEKAEYGEKWEDWQHFFWETRGVKENADDGFNEFIKWIILIEKFTSKENQVSLKNEEKIDIFKSIYQTKDFIKYISSLDIKCIEKYYEAIKKLNHYGLIEDKWLNGGVRINNVITQIYYMHILPLLLTMIKNDSMPSREYERYKKFFLNRSRLVDISKNPDSYVIKSIELISNFDVINKDILGLRLIEDSKNYYNHILTDAERFKMKILAEKKTLREEIEEIFWKAEELDILNGDITILLDCVNIDNFVINEFLLFYEKFKELFSVNTIMDETRQALLSIDDYGISEGYTYRKKRYSFQITKGEFNGKESEILKECIKELLKKIIHKNMSLQDIKNEFTDTKNWRYDFIHDNRFFKYTRKKKITWDEENEKPFIILKGNDGNSDSKKFDEYKKN